MSLTVTQNTWLNLKLYAWGRHIRTLSPSSALHALPFIVSQWCTKKHWGENT